LVIKSYYNHTDEGGCTNMGRKNEEKLGCIESAVLKLSQRQDQMEATQKKQAKAINTLSKKLNPGKLSPLVEP
jgi:hypothetical protein